MKINNRNLTKREAEILTCICNGYTNIEISRALKLSLNTVKVHVKHIYKKLDVTNRTEAAMSVQGNAVQDKNSVPLLIIDNFSKNIHDSVSIKMKHMVLQLQDKLLKFLIQKDLFYVCTNSSPYELNENQENYRVYGQTEKIGNKMLLSVYLETYPRHYYLWNENFIIDSSNSLIELSAQQIAASLTYHLLEKEAIHQVIARLPEKSTFQKLILSIHLLNESTNTSINAAKKFLDEILAICPEHIVGLYSRCIASYLAIITNCSKNPEQDSILLAQYCKKLTQITRNNAKSYYVRGLYCLLQKNRIRAIHLFQKAVSIDPSFQECYLMLAQIYALNNDKTDAEYMLNRAFSLCADYQYKGNNLIAVGIIYFCLKKYDKAIHFLEENFCVQENHIFESLLYICCLYMSGNINAAMKFADKVNVDDEYINTILQFTNEDLALYIKKMLQKLHIVTSEFV
ncbi:helix-turn-helix domain-containing protein [Pectinatus sottacetonis]|uniref:helix-turn-helix domain-containing protein n=1 Tax=Pectinatus sottacetonis TaxID=1002795 RepID=UPI0018C6A7FE|nr:helix-turn-helix transcriptional regulator [Pectinatus sottacetonis]